MGATGESSRASKSWATVRATASNTCIARASAAEGAVSGVTERRISERFRSRLAKTSRSSELRSLGVSPAKRSARSGTPGSIAMRATIFDGCLLTQIFFQIRVELRLNRGRVEVRHLDQRRRQVVNLVRCFPIELLDRHLHGLATHAERILNHQ